MDWCWINSIGSYACVALLAIAIDAQLEQAATKPQPSCKLQCRSWKVPMVHVRRSNVLRCTAYAQACATDHTMILPLLCASLHVTLDAIASPCTASLDLTQNAFNALVRALPVMECCTFYYLRVELQKFTPTYIICIQLCSFQILEHSPEMYPVLCVCRSLLSACAISAQSAVASTSANWWAVTLWSHLAKVVRVRLHVRLTLE